MTTVLPTPTVDTGAEADDATPGCGCCIPPPGAGAKDKVLAELQARREGLDRRLRDLR